MNRNQENYAVGDDGSSRRGQKKKTTGGPGKEIYGATVRMRINLKISEICKPCLITV